MRASVASIALPLLGETAADARLAAGEGQPRRRQSPAVAVAA